ncbi:hypothetical protein D7D52_20255 [Nocardia yunnanensis]|uniref:Uncharacterized protein n=1 Tax=Nocardia yunnanensis TaxID=2382165 RepID=A0A386ZGR4_9NOCA|nr:hypothetical protein [Nocardia yunnanensis]AYF75785.1 hypothetical protein D7D52_20255 [Nocardia yunnanensis]
MSNPLVFDHSELPVMTIEYAHLIMQRHRNCLVSVCAVKNQAKRRLIECGALVPADAPHIGS